MRQEEEIGTKFFHVVLPVPLRKSLIYHLPASLSERARPGCRVKVPLGPRPVVGCLLEEAQAPSDFKTREVLEVLDETPLLAGWQLKMIPWASAYYLTPPGEVFRHLLPRRLLETKGKRAPASSLQKKKERKFEGPAVPLVGELSPGQKKILETIRLAASRNNHGGPKPVLIHGVTGSGKTEVYLELVREVIEKGGQALVLVPEIGLTPQLVGRFRGLSAPVAVYHSALTEAERFRVWSEAREGRSPVTVATRSGIFLPFPNLKIIVIDEEHDASFKQEERFCYHARDLALWRAKEEKILILLGSATPSLESLYRAQQGKMEHVRLTQRPSGVLLPSIEIIDRRGEKKSHSLFTERLQCALKENLKKGEQSLLYLNRRGYASFVLCSQCGYVPRCDDCDISLTLHKGRGGETAPLLVCHYCDRKSGHLSICPKCRTGLMNPLGSGTERVDLELRRLFPGARVVRMDRDTVKGDDWLKVLEKMKKGEIDILVGTQMIAKGHDYSGITLVGILDADVGIHLPDFRASERTFQLIAQVSGRAGRGARPGRVFIQTYQPSHAGLIAAATQEGGDFFEKELAQRREAGFPPFKRLIEIRLSGTERQGVIAKTRELSEKIKRSLPAQEAVLLGPAPCVIEKVRGKARWRILIKTSHYLKIQPALSRLLDSFAEKGLPSNMRMLVNVDPVDMM